MKLLVATNNRGKLAEMRTLLNLPGLELVTPLEAGLPADLAEASAVVMSRWEAFKDAPPDIQQALEDLHDPWGGKPA